MIGMARRMCVASRDNDTSKVQDGGSIRIHMTRAHSNVVS